MGTESSSVESTNISVIRSKLNPETSKQLTDEQISEFKAGFDLFD